MRPILVRIVILIPNGALTIASIITIPAAIHPSMSMILFR
jgi:hypothetical protein